MAISTVVDSNIPFGMVEALVIIHHTNRQKQRLRVIGEQSSIMPQVIAVLTMQGDPTDTPAEIVSLVKQSNGPLHAND